ncbi:Pyridoxal phosphate homeostasis protein [bioreactor metagenome]|uniref:Pyridoxal phosphate homeostasis protein n=2 Tax=root TaxID=1 RepID=A0ABT1NA09_9FIRM|nr:MULTISPECIES: YggS family pyridoxal phosphate-dependent enzyme [Lutispora]MCQ1528089.1 YggS family pyridoxal phosphate-dependent enzyme [Lutispora saccharofermentans]MEA4962030.1 YggS family pyridoxal phosphate-dependent enzyme [Lutispora sp.]
MNSISENIEIIKNEIKEICNKKGMNYDEITLIAVTKTIGIMRIKEAIASGINDIGENKVQEIMDKYEDLKELSNFHLIGHLQSNKVKYIIDKVKLIHSVDSLSLMDEINKRAKKAETIANILIQINVAREDTKFGIGIEELDSYIEYASKLDSIRVQGLMTIAPYFEDAEEARSIFRNLKSKYDELSKRDYGNIEMKFLSMGMTNDYKIALEEGSNMIRVGTGIFGKRIYNL